MSTNCIPDWQHAVFSFYRYTPTVAAAAIFCILFLLSSILHLFQMCKTRCWYLTPLVVGCFCAFMPRHSSFETFTIWLTFNYGFSWVYWLCWPRCIWDRKSRLLDTRAIPHSEHVHFACTGIICSVHLHDTRPNHNSCWGSGSFNYSTAMAHQDIRHRRHHLLLTSCWR